jgi:hypothetical protein
VPWSKGVVVGQRLLDQQQVEGVQLRRMCGILQSVDAGVD